MVHPSTPVSTPCPNEVQGLQHVTPPYSARGADPRGHTVSAPFSWTVQNRQDLVGTGGTSGSGPTGHGFFRVM